MHSVPSGDKVVPGNNFFMLEFYCHYVGEVGEEEREREEEEDKEWRMRNECKERRKGGRMRMRMRI